MSTSPASVASPRIYKGTELDQINKIVTVRDYGDGVVEVGISSVPTPNTPDVDRRRVSPQADAFPEAKPECLDRSLRRSKATVRRKCMAGGLDHLLTLTYRENMTDTEQGHKDVTRFLRLVRKSQPNYKYVMVAEYQKRGAIHFHLAVKGFQQVQLLRSIWRSVIGEGNIDVSRKNYTGRAQWRMAKLAGYLTKYITKDALTAFGRQRYRVAEGIEIPKKTRIISFPVGVDWLGEIFDSLGASIKHRYESEDGWAWAASW